MPTLGSFVLPIQNDSPCDSVRAAYQKHYNRPWPYDDNFIRELAREVPDTNELRETNQTRNDYLLDLMRENEKD